ncbi:1991_t:CDS:2, partial [Paraglomus brasilianum]
ESNRDQLKHQLLEKKLEQVRNLVADNQLEKLKTIKPQVYEGLPPPPLPPKEKRIIVPKKDDNFEKHFSPRSDIPRDKKCLEADLAEEAAEQVLANTLMLSKLKTNSLLLLVLNEPVKKVEMLVIELVADVIEVLKFQADLNQLQIITPKHQKQILELEAEIKSIEAKYKENMVNAAKETDPAKKAKFVAAAQAAETELKKVKQKLRNNPLTKLIQYSHLLNYTDDLEKLFRGNVPKQPPTVPDVPSSNPSDPNDSGGSGRGTNPTGGGSG